MDVIGAVSIGENCYVGPGARIKSDYGTIKIGIRSNIQENCVIHARPGKNCITGDDCFISHGSILHNCTIKNGARVGIGAVVSDYAVVGEGAVLAGGCVVKQNQEIPPHSVAMGVPARVTGERLCEQRATEQEGYRNVYVDLAKRYLAGLKRVEWHVYNAYTASGKGLAKDWQKRLATRGNGA